MNEYTAEDLGYIAKFYNPKDSYTGKKGRPFSNAEEIGLALGRSANAIIEKYANLKKKNKLTYYIKKWEELEC